MLRDRVVRMGSGVIMAVLIGGFFLDVPEAQAVVRTWDGGGGADTNWGTCANWTGDTCPTSSDVATFDATSTNNVTIAVSLSGATAPAGIDINAGYTGTITQNSGVTISIGATGFDQAAGTFTGGDSAITINGNFTLSAGTFTSTTGTLTVSGGWTHTAGGTFAPNSGTVTYIGGSGTIDVNSTEAFYNLIINTTPGWYRVIANSDTLTVANTLTLSDGYIDQSTIPAAGSIVVQGDISHGANFDGGTAQINLEGSGTASFSSGFMTGFKLNGAGAVATGPSSGTLTFEHHLTIADGTFNAGAGAMTLLGSTKNFSQSGGVFNGGVGTVTFPGAVGISGGTFNGGSTTTFSCNSCTFTFSGGTLAPGSGTLNLATHWTQSAGATFTEGTSTVNFYEGNGDKTINVNVAETFYNLTIGDAATSGWHKTLANSDTLNVSNDLTFTDGYFDQTTVPGTGSIAVSGHVTVGAGYDGGSAKLVFSGSASQNFNLTGATALYNGDIAVNKSGGEVALLSALTMNANSQDLTIQEGTLDLSGFALSVAAGATETIVVETGGNLQLQGGEAITGDSASYPQLDSGSTVTYDGAAGPYTMKNYTYHHLVIAGGASSVFTQAANESYAGNVTITSGILSQGGFTTTVVGTFENLGTLRRLQTETFTGTMDVDSGTVEYVGDADAQEIVTITDFGGGGADYYNLKINDTNVTKDIFTIGAGLTLAGTLQVTSAEFQQSTYAIIASALTVDGGTFTGGSGAITTSGAVTVSSGTLTSTTNTLSVGGAWTHTAGGTFTHSSGTVSFTGSSATADVDTSETFSALTINKTDGQTLTVASGDTLIATGVLTLTDGTWATGSVQAQGNVAVPSTWDAGGSGILEFAGSGTQTFDLTGAVAAFDNPVNVNKSGGSLTLASDYTLDHANADFTVTLGTFSTGNYALTTSAGSDIAVNGGIFNAGSSALSLGGAVTVAGGAFNNDSSTATYSGAFLLSSGAYNGNTSAPTFSGGLTISGGGFTASSETTTVSGAWTHTGGGTFTHNSGVVVFTGNAATIDVATSESFNVLTINKNTGQTLTIASGDSLIAAGTIALTDGAVGTGALDARGNVTVVSTFDGGDAPLSFGGSVAQSFDLTGATNKFDGDIVVAKSAETVSLASNAVFDAAGQDVTVTSGTFSANTRNLTIAGNVAVNGGTMSLSTGTIELNGNLAVGGGTLNMGSATVTLAGDTSYTSGTMTPGTSTVTLDGANQAITGATSWNNLTKTVATAATLTFPASTTTTVGGTLTLAGAASQLLSLRSSTIDVPATIDPANVTAPSYVDVRDVTITKSTMCITSTQHCVNSGGNSGWTFLVSGDDEPPIQKSVRVLSPNGGEMFVVGETVPVTWTTTGRVGFVNISLSSDGGTTWTRLLTQIPNTERANVMPESVETSSAVVRVEAYDGVEVYASDVSNGVFAITAAEVVEEEVLVEEEVIEDEVIEDEIAEVTERVVRLPSTVAIHGIVKLADDGDARTQHDATVYYIGADGMRHAFPSEAVYLSWFCDFSQVHIVDDSILSALVFGENITYRPGSQLVKFLTSPKVYVVDTFGILRWVTSESLASLLYGDTWSQQVRDISDAFFSNYVIGDAVESESDFVPDVAREGVIYPSDSMHIPGYSGASAEPAQCADAL